MWNRKNYLPAAINDWRDRGLLDEQTASSLIADTDARTSNFSFQNILILLAVICLGFAAMTFVAANWDDMARLVRVGVIVGAMWVFWAGSAFFQMRDQTWFAQVFTLGACAMFGAGIMLISQIYHIQGSAKDATWLWAMGTLLAAALTRSIPALALSIVLLIVWSWLEPSMWSWRNPEYQYSFLGYMVLCGALAYWVQSRFCAHVVVLATISWAVPTAISLLDDSFYIFSSLLIGFGFILISLMLFSDRRHNWLRGFERALIFYAISVIGFMCFFWSMEFKELVTAQYFLLIAFAAFAASVALAVLGHRLDHPNKYDLTVTAIFTVLTLACMGYAIGDPLPFMALLLAASIWVIRMGWRIEYRPIAVLGFIAFGLMMLWIYFVTIGTLLGTSVFYAVAGILLLAGVFIIPRLTRTPTAEDAS